MITLFLIGIPLSFGLLSFALGARASRTLALLSSLLSLAITLFAAYTFVPNDQLQYDFEIAWLAGSGIYFSLAMDGISLLMVLLTNILLPVIILSGFFNNYSSESKFFGLILLMQSALVGVFVAQDAFLYYLFWEAALIPIYFICALWGGPRRVQITFKFFIYTVFGSLFLLFGLVYLYFQTGGSTGLPSASLESFYALNLDLDTQKWLFWVLFIAFAIKMPIFPFHTWQPDTYTEAPAQGSMLLSGVMLKMGTYSVLRWLLPIVPLGAQYWQTLVIVLSIIGIVYGAIIAIRQDDFKRLIAYSSFSHVGLISAGLFTFTVSGLNGALIQMLAHGVAVTGLFFVADAIRRRTQTLDLARLGGLTAAAPALTVYFIIFVLASVALPLSSGFVGEFLLLKSLFEVNIWYAATAGLTLIFGAVYMLRLFQVSMFGSAYPDASQITDLTFTEKLAFFPLAVLVFWIGIYPSTFMNLVGPSVEKLHKIIIGAA